MLHLIGLGLNENGISSEALDAIKKSEKVYLENYTVEFPYSQETLEKQIGKKIIPANREFVEQKIDELLTESKTKDVALLIYGSPFTATTHITIIQEAKKKKVPVKVIHSGSIFDAVAETGLQVYKFGKTASMPGFDADSYTAVVSQNQSIKAHTIILIDIGLDFSEALDKIVRDTKKNNISLNKIIVCSRLGTSDSKIFYDAPKNLNDEKVKAPFCIIIPSELHFVEKEFLESI
ncbi:MAG: diphthine synthase [Nanoarchaeota archaeon]|nr:diphthine synthase [Nanoarchaeota archaeon]MBU1501547.1 diphthine synthase [Nanoarchaeota archaeon]MBU2459150.1 diphthine synthase [Nanoarchaeota archaeon]